MLIYISITLKYKLFYIKQEENSLLFSNKKGGLMNQKVHYRLNSKEKWLLTGLTTLSLCLGTGISANLVKAESNEKPIPIALKDNPFQLN